MTASTTALVEGRPYPNSARKVVHVWQTRAATTLVTADVIAANCPELLPAAVPVAVCTTCTASERASYSLTPALATTVVQRLVAVGVDGVEDYVMCVGDRGGIVGVACLNAGLPYCGYVFDDQAPEHVQHAAVAVAVSDEAGPQYSA